MFTRPVQIRRLAYTPLITFSKLDLIERMFDVKASMSLELEAN